MKGLIMVNQGTNYLGRRFFVFRASGYVFQVKELEKGLTATAPVNTQTSALGKKWDLPNWRETYRTAYAEAGRILATEKKTGQLSLF
jgi:hypothetical protein